MKKKLWAFDTEDNSKGKVYLINFYDGETHHTFKDQKEAVQFLMKLEGKHEFWATNLQYDLINTFGDSLHYLEIGYVGSRVISASIVDTDIRFMDTLNHWKISVAEMGSRIGLEKLNNSGNFNNEAYCRRDTEITFNFVATMRKHYESIGCELKATIGSTALKLFENRYYIRRNKRIFKKKHIEFMLKGYYGGRTEIFFNRPVEGNIQYFDFNSLYPACMLEKYPNLKENQFYFTKTPNLKHEGIVHARIKSPHNLNIPYLPVRRRDNGSLFFPLGTFTGHWTYFEIREAKKLGYEIKKIYRALEFSAGSSKPFETFVTDLYAKRLKAQSQNDTLLSDAFKLLLNNLYGKFGQGNEYTKLMPLEKNQKLNPGDTVFENFVLKKEKGDYPLHTNVIWPAYVTAYGRHRLWNAMQKVEKQNGLLIYCDTDCVIFESDKQIFNQGNKLGELKSEGVFEYAWFKLPKLYKLIEMGGKKKYRTKGVPRKNAEEFFETGKTSFQKPYKLRETLRRNLSPKRKVKLIANFWDEVEKMSYKIYDKRKVLKNGNTEPVRI
jgi:hypothetical protein